MKAHHIPITARKTLPKAYPRNSSLNLHIQDYAPARLVRREGREGNTSRVSNVVSGRTGASLGTDPDKTDHHRRTDAAYHRGKDPHNNATPITWRTTPEEPAGADNNGDTPVLSKQGKIGNMFNGAVILLANLPALVKCRGIRCSFPFFTSGLPPPPPRLLGPLAADLTSPAPPHPLRTPPGHLPAWGGRAWGPLFGTL